MLYIDKLRVKKDDVTILNDLSLSVHSNEIHVIMGPNGSGKSTLAYTLAGAPDCQIVGGAVSFCDKPLFDLSPDMRARAGLFVAFQHPVVIPGLGLLGYLKTLYTTKQTLGTAPVTTKIPPTVTTKEFIKIVEPYLHQLQLPKETLDRSLNENFSGGEVKKLEILQMLLLEPQLAVLDEIDSGVDIDALQIISHALLDLKTKTNCSFIIITHHAKILQYINPDKVHIIEKGRLVRSGGVELIKQLEKSGYASLMKG